MNPRLVFCLQISTDLFLERPIFLGYYLLCQTFLGFHMDGTFCVRHLAGLLPVSLRSELTLVGVSSQCL